MLAREASIPFAAFYQKRSRLQQAAYDLAARYPLALREAPRGQGSLAAVKTMLVDTRRRQLQGDNAALDESDRRNLANFKWALGTVLGRLPGGDDTPAKTVLLSSLDRIAAEPGSGTRRKQKQELTRALELLDQIACDDGLPAAFDAALRQACETRGITLTDLATAIGSTIKTVSGWVCGKFEPANRSAHLVRRMEGVLGCPGSLTSRLQRPILFRSLAESRCPPELRGKAAQHLRRTVAFMLAPDDFDLPDEELHDACREVLATVKGWTSSFNHAIRTLIGVPYALKTYPDQLNAEVDAYTGLNKSLFTDDEIIPDAHTLCPGTESLLHTLFKGLFGFARLPKETSTCSDDALKMPGGLGISESALHLYLVACPALVRRFLQFKKQRLIAVARKELFTDFDMRILLFARKMTRPETGYVAQLDLTMDHLAPVKHLMPPQLVRAFEQSWAKGCEEAYSTYTKLISAYAKKIGHVPQDERLHRVLPILKLPYPLGALLYFDKRVVEELDRLPAGRLRDRKLRDRVIVGIQTQFAFRKATAVALDVRHIVKRDDGRWYVSIAKDDFKNRNSKIVFQVDGKWVDYDRPIRNIDGLYAHLEEYLEADGARARLLGSDASDALFVVTNSNLGGKRKVKADKARFVSEGFAIKMAELTMRYLAWSPRTRRGIPGVGRFGNHNLRRILATGVYRFTNGDLSAAAKAIADSMKTTWTAYIYIDHVATAEATSRSIEDGMREGFALASWI